MKLSTKHIALIALMAAACACGSRQSESINVDKCLALSEPPPSPNESTEIKKFSPPAVNGESASQDASQATESQIQQAQQPVTGIERKIIREGEITFRTDDTKRTRASIDQAVKNNGGYISRDEISYLSDQTRYEMTVRIPAARFDNVLDAVSANAVRIDSKSIRANDVTEEFIDISARLKTKKELEARYLDLLHKATKVDDILSIEQQAGDLRSDIEATEGRLRYLTDQVSMSTLSVTFYDQTEKVHDFGFWHKMGAALGTGWRVLLAVFIGIAHLWALIIVGLGVFFGIRYWRRKRKLKKQKK